jgi:hypothetical protein
MAEGITFIGKFIKESDKARCFESKTGERLWIPKSIFTYYSKDRWGDVRFSVEGWKEDDVCNAGFKYF